MTTMEAAAGLLQQRRDKSHEHVNKVVGYAHKLVKKKKKNNNNNNKKSRCNYQTRIPFKSPMALQQLFLSCSEVFKGPGTVPAPFDVQKLCRILDEMRPEDVGLSSKLQLFSGKDTVKGTPIVTSTTIYKCMNFSLHLFFLPPTAVIPLHNHPGMTGFCKLLLGTMHIKSYDLVDSAPASQSRLAKLVADSDFTAPCNTSVLYPTTGGNIHQFTAITTCAVLDVLGPPYSKEDGRDCSYYKEELPLPKEDDDDGDGGSSLCFRCLEEIEAPENSHMDEIDYLGPQIIDTSY